MKKVIKEMTIKRTRNNPWSIMMAIGILLGIIGNLILLYFDWLLKFNDKVQQQEVYQDDLLEH